MFGVIYSIYMTGKMQKEWVVATHAYASKNDFGHPQL